MANDSNVTVATSANWPDRVKGSIGNPPTADRMFQLSTIRDLFDTRYPLISHNQDVSTITGFSEAVDDRVAALLVAGTNITLTYNDASNTLTISASGGGTGGASVLNDLGDVAISGTPSQLLGHFLRHNGTEFINIAPVVAHLTDSGATGRLLVQAASALAARGTLGLNGWSISFPFSGAVPAAGEVIATIVLDADVTFQPGSAGMDQSVALATSGVATATYTVRHRTALGVTPTTVATITWNNSQTGVFGGGGTVAALRNSILEIVATTPGAMSAATFSLRGALT